MALLVTLGLSAGVAACAATDGPDESAPPPTETEHRSGPVVVDGIEYALELDDASLAPGASASARLIATNVSDTPVRFPPDDGSCVEKFAVGLVPDPGDVPDLFFTAECQLPVGLDQLAPGTSTAVELELQAIEPEGAIDLAPGTYCAKVVASGGGVCSDVVPIEVAEP